MADERDDRTEAASPARLARARSEGQAPVSHELASLANLGAAILIIALDGPRLADQAARQLARLLANAGRTDGPAALSPMLREAVATATGCFLPIAVAVLMAGVAAVLSQTRFALRMQGFLDISRISPLAGTMRLLSVNHGVDALKSILKIGVMSIALWFTLASQVRWLPPVLLQGTDGVTTRLKGEVILVAATLLLVQAVIAAMDVAWSHLRFAHSMRMSREDVKQEAKDSDGNPQVKARFSAIRNARARQNLKKAMAGATVVITNPTHYAVALRYDGSSNTAPKIIAKGIDELAARIRELAREGNVPVVPNPPLARALYTLDLDDEIPSEHYKAVADIIAYIWRLETQAAQARMI